MTQRRRATSSNRELAAAKRPSGTDGKSFAAIERIHLGKTDREEIRFSARSATRLLPRALSLPEDELLPLLEAALGAGVFSPAFVARLRSLLGEGAPPAEPEVVATPLERIQSHFHALIRARAGDRLSPAASLPSLSEDAPTEQQPGWFPVEGMEGGFRYWWDATAEGPRLISESSFRVAAGSGQLHEVTPTGASLLGEGFD